MIEEGYLKDQKKAKAAVGGGDEMIIQLKFDRENRPIILRHEAGQHARSAGLCRRQRSRRRSAKDLGINVLSTPKGILVDREALSAKVGGELICSVW